MTAAQTRWGTGANAEAIEAWDGPLFDRFVRFRDIVTTGLGAHGEAALRCPRRAPGQRVLDVGCGFGDTTQRIAELVGPERRGGRRRRRAALHRGRDARRPAQAGVANARFAVADVQATRSASASTSPSRASGRCSSPTRSRRCATCATRSSPAAGS